MERGPLHHEGAFDLKEQHNDKHNYKHNDEHNDTIHDISAS